MATTRPLSVPSKRLAVAITSSASSFQVNNILKWDGTTDLASSDFGTTAYVVFRNDTNTRMELMEIDPSTIASPSITISNRGLGWGGTDLATVAAARKLDWPANETIVEFGSNPPQLLNDYVDKGNTQTLTGAKTFTQTAMPRLDAQHTYGAGEEEYLATKRYADSLAIAGAPDASTTQKGIVEEATQAEVDARTAAGGTSARLFINPSTLRAALYHDVAVDSVGTDSYAITVTPAPSAYAQGQVFQFKAGTANTGAATLNVNSLGAITIKKANGADLETNDIRANQIVQVVYNSTGPVFNMQSILGNEFASEVDVQSGTLTYAADAGGTDTYAITLSPAPTAYANGMMLNFKANTANTGAATLNVNSLGAITIKKLNDQDLDTGDIEANQIVTVVYNSTGPVFEMVSQVAQAPLISAARITNEPTVNGSTPTLRNAAGTVPAPLHTETFDVLGEMDNGFKAVTCTAGTNTTTVVASGATFTSADVGRWWVNQNRTGAANYQLITVFNSSTSITINAAITGQTSGDVGYVYSGKFTAAATGYYQVNAMLNVSNGTLQAQSFNLFLYKNGSQHSQAYSSGASTEGSNKGIPFFIGDLVQLSAGGTLQCFMNTSVSGSDVSIGGAAASSTIFTVKRVS